MTNDFLAHLNADERSRVTRALRALPPDTPLHLIDWDALFAAARVQRRDKSAGSASATVGELIADAAAEQERRRTKAVRILEAKLDKVGRNLVHSGRAKPRPLTPAEHKRAEADLRQFVTNMRQRRAWVQHCIATFGNHGTDPNARPWPDMPKELQHPDETQETHHASAPDEPSPRDTGLPSPRHRSAPLRSR